MKFYKSKFLNKFINANIYIQFSNRMQITAFLTAGIFCSKGAV